MPDDTLFISIYTDQHVLIELADVLRALGFNAQTTQEAGNEELTDSDQLAYATSQDMAILTYDIADFTTLAREWYEAGRDHAGIILSEPFNKREFGELLRQVLKLLDTLTADEIRNTAVILQQFR
jgi:predicted nuclease of predicted toxin-antitoxin system